MRFWMLVRKLRGWLQQSSATCGLADGHDTWWFGPGFSWLLPAFLRFGIGVGLLGALYLAINGMGLEYWSLRGFCEEKDCWTWSQPVFGDK